MTTAPNDVILQIIFISIGMVLLSQWFQKRFSLPRETQMHLQERLQNIQNEMRVSQSNPRQMQSLQNEMMEIMRTIMKKQMAPMCARSILFLGIWGLLGLLYGQYDEVIPFWFIFGRGWFALYFLVSIILSIIIALIKKEIKKRKPQDEQGSYIDTIQGMKNNLVINQRAPAMYQPQYSLDQNAGVNVQAHQEVPINLEKLSGDRNANWKQKLVESDPNDIDEDLPDPNLNSNSISTPSKDWKKKLNLDD
jgi:uncharacterized membrane protein (DUF106 family)